MAKTKFKRIHPAIIILIMGFIFFGNMFWAISMHENIHVAQFQVYGCDSEVSINLLSFSGATKPINCPDDLDVEKLNYLTAQAETTYAELQSSFMLGGILAVLVGMFLCKIKWK